MTTVPLPDRRQPSNWRRATDQHRDARANRLLDLLDELNEILKTWEHEIRQTELESPGLDTRRSDNVLIYKQRLETMVQTYRGGDRGDGAETQHGG
jgi:hypothetical protein